MKFGRVSRSGILLCAPLAFFSTPALADDGADMLEACASAAERGQVLRHEGKLLEAGDEFRACDAADCPAVVRADCSRWSVELEEETPSVVLRARDSRGRDVIDVRVSANHRVLTAHLDGEAVALDPGRYDFSYEAASGDVAIETVLLALGDKRREVTGTFSVPLDADGSAAPQPPPRSLVAPPRAVAADAPRRTTATGALPYVLAGASVAALGAFGYFELVGQRGYSDLESGCGHTQTCTEREVDPVRTDFVAAASFLGVAVVFAGLATWQFLTPRRPARAGWLQTLPPPGRAMPGAPLVRF